MGKLLAYSHKPVYLGVTLNRSLAYKYHIAKTKAKTGARNSIFKKLTNTNWGTDARTIRTTALVLCFFSSADYASQSGAYHIDPVLSAACRASRNRYLQVRVRHDPPGQAYIASGQGLNDAKPLCRNGDTTRMDRLRANVGMN